MKTIPFGFVAVPLEITEELKEAMSRRGVENDELAQFWTELLNAAQVAFESRPAVDVDQFRAKNKAALDGIKPRRPSLLECCREAWARGI